MTSESSATRTVGEVIGPAIRSGRRRRAAAAVEPPGARPRPAATAGRRGRPWLLLDPLDADDLVDQQADAAGAIVKDQHLARLAAAQWRHHSDGVPVAVQQAGNPRPWVG